MRRALFAVPALCGVLAAAEVTAAEVHGESDAFATDGIAIAWGILRAANPDDATVVIRVARDERRHPALGVTAVDPFGGEAKVLRAAAPAPPVFDVRSPRRRFADLPRTELQFVPAVPPCAARPAQLTIYYVGVPDTTPEFDSEAKLDAWLRDRVAKLLAKSGGKTP